MRSLRFQDFAVPGSAICGVACSITQQASHWHQMYFVSPPADDVAIALQQRLESCFRDHGGVIFSSDPTLVSSISARARIRFQWRLRACDPYPRFTQFLAERK